MKKSIEWHKRRLDVWSDYLWELKEDASLLEHKILELENDCTLLANQISVAEKEDMTEFDDKTKKSIS